jgi:hypothetical protein
MLQADIITKAREITGNKPDRSAAELEVPDAAITAEMARSIRDLNRIYGSASSVKEVKFHPVANQQDYAIATYVGSDVYRIDLVLRSNQDYPAGTLVDTSKVPQRYQNLNNQVIHPGLQQDVFDTIEQMARASRADECDFEEIGGNLRLFPTPTDAAEWVYVRYTATGYSISTLPDETESALIFAAVVAILNCQLNRLNSDRFSTRNQGETTDQRVRVLERQRDEYKASYLSELASLRKG